MYIGLHLEYQLFLWEFNLTGIFSTDFRKILKYKLRKYPSIGIRDVTCSQTGRRNDRQTWRSFSQFC